MKEFAIVAAFLTALLLGCDTSDVVTPSTELQDIVIVPQTATMEPGDNIDFSVHGITAEGDTVPAPEVRWWSSDSTVFDVDETGLATALSPGQAYCMVETLAASKAAFNGRDSALVMIF